MIGYNSKGHHWGHSIYNTSCTLIYLETVNLTVIHTTMYMYNNNTLTLNKHWSAGSETLPQGSTLLNPLNQQQFYLHSTHKQESFFALDAPKTEITFFFCDTMINAVFSQ